MIYLDILIGFSLVMLVFASGVSVVQTFLKRVLLIKGKALTEPLLDEIERAYRKLGDGADVGKVKEQAAAALHGPAAVVGKLLRSVSLAQGAVVLEQLRRTVAKGLGPDEKAQWNKAVASVGEDWDRVATRLTASYEQRTRRWVVGISLAAVLLFNVDAIRILQVLSVSPEVRAKLVAATEHVHEKGASELPDGDVKAAYGALNDWQKGNLAALSSTGMPIGWGKVSMYVVDNGGLRRDCLWGERCSGTTANGPTFWLWLYRLVGLFVGAGLISQGAPFWYSILDTVFGLKKKAQSPAVADAEIQLKKTIAEAEAWPKVLGAQSDTRRDAAAAPRDPS